MITVGRRFNGPPDSGNGGYVAGLLARHAEGLVEVTLRRPPPLERAMSLQRVDGVVRMVNGEAVVAEASAIAAIDIDLPAAVGVEEAIEAAKGYPGFEDHFFPTCFVCGPERADGDGLRIFTGPVRGRDIVAAPWTPDASLLDGAGRVATEFVWAALDCPGAWNFRHNESPIVLGRMAARIDRDMRAEETYVVMGWAAGRDGRKLFAGTAVYDEAGQPVAVARQTWIELRDGS